MASEEWALSKFYREDARGRLVFSWGAGEGLPFPSLHAPVFFTYEDCRAEPGKLEAQLAVPTEKPPLTGPPHSQSHTATRFPCGSSGATSEPASGGEEAGLTLSRCSPGGCGVRRWQFRAWRSGRKQPFLPNDREKLGEANTKEPQMRKDRIACCFSPCGREGEGRKAHTSPGQGGQSGTAISRQIHLPALRRTFVAKRLLMELCAFLLIPESLMHELLYPVPSGEQCGWLLNSVLMSVPAHLCTWIDMVPLDPVIQAWY